MTTGFVPSDPSQQPERRLIVRAPEQARHVRKLSAYLVSKLNANILGKINERKDRPNSGSLLISVTEHERKDIEKAVENFYENQGFEITNPRLCSKGVIGATRGKDHYWNNIDTKDGNRKEGKYHISILYDLIDKLTV